jgi:hypothetical protein
VGCSTVSSASTTVAMLDKPTLALASRTPGQPRIHARAAAPRRAAATIINSATASVAAGDASANTQRSTSPTSSSCTTMRDGRPQHHALHAQAQIGRDAGVQHHQR